VPLSIIKTAGIIFFLNSPYLTVVVFVAIHINGDYSLIFDSLSLISQREDSFSVQFHGFPIQLNYVWSYNITSYCVHTYVLLYTTLYNKDCLLACWVLLKMYLYDIFDIGCNVVILITNKVISY